MSVLVITTGGTIGALPYKDFSHTADEDFVAIMPNDGRNFVREELEKNLDFKGRCIALQAIDSKLMDEIYRFNILTLIESASENRILITHGTDALLQSADYFYNHVNNNAALCGKTIILTGSMMPLSNGQESDGYLNLAFSMRQLEQWNEKEKSGVYIVLCDYESLETQSGTWKPNLYHYFPGTYEKVYTKNGRYNRLRQVKQNA